DAKKMCKDLILVTGHHRLYVEFHHKIIAAVDRCVPVHSICSIDEIACELTGSQLQIEVAQKLAVKIKKQVAMDVGECLTCSIGIAPNILLAKMAADMQKPDGLTVLEKKDLLQKLSTLQLQDVPGIGARMEKRLQQKGVRRMSELLQKSEQEMESLWGSIIGRRYYQLLRGECVTVRPTQQKSIGHQHVLPPKERNHLGGYKVALKLTEKACVRLRKSHFMARRFSVYIKCVGIQPQRFEKDWHFSDTQNTADFLNMVGDFFTSLSKKIKPLKIAVVLFDFIDETQHQLSFFENEKRTRVFTVVDQINQKHGKGTIYPAILSQTTDKAPTRIAFTRIPELDEV
ncbi:MAG: DNA polymerase Y family protein, partial [Pseudobdellovibrionaceae bacterium]